MFGANGAIRLYGYTVHTLTHNTYTLTVSWRGYDGRARGRINEYGVQIIYFFSNSNNITKLLSTQDAFVIFYRYYAPGSECNYYFTTLRAAACYEKRIIWFIILLRNLRQRPRQSSLLFSMYTCFDPGINDPPASDMTINYDDYRVYRGILKCPICH